MKIIMTVLGLFGLAFGVASDAPAQELSALKLEIDRLARAAPEEHEELVAELRDNLWKAVYLGPGQALVADILTFRRADIQSGSGSGASGSTSAVLSPLLPSIVGIGLENGALTRTVSGTTVTFKAMPAGLICASRVGAAARVVRRDDEACRSLWRRVGVTASFDTSRGKKDAQLQNFETLTGQFAELAVRVEIVNRRKATGARYIAAFQRDFEEWQKAATAFAALDRRTLTIAQAEQDISGRLLKLVGSDAWKAAAPEARARQVQGVLTEVLSRTTVVDTMAQEIRQAWLAALRADARLQNSIANAPVLTAEYAFQQPDLTTAAIGTIVPAGGRPPRLHSGRVIFARGWADRGLDLTAHAAASWFDDVRPGMRGRFRDARSGAEAKFKLRDLAIYGTPTLSFAGLYTYLNQEPLGLGLIAFNQAKITEKGHIGLFQVKLEFPAANNTIRIPLSFSYSNRTELIKESQVRGQVGVSLNLDGLFAGK